MSAGRLVLSGADWRRLAALIGRGAAQMDYAVAQPPDGDGVLVCRADGRQWHITAERSRALPHRDLVGDLTTTPDAPLR